MGLIYGNKCKINEEYIINEQVILEKANISKEDLLKDPKGTIEKLKHLKDSKENITGDISFLLYIISFVSLLVGATLTTLAIPATGLFLASSVSGFILDYLNQKGKLTILSYNKYTRDARAIHKAITKEIVKLDKIIKENKNPKVTEKAKKEKYELEKILKSYKKYKSEEEYYAAHGYRYQDVEYAKSDIKDFINAYKNKEYLYNVLNGTGLFYTGVTQQEFEKFINVYIKKYGNKIYEDDLWEYVEDYHGSEAEDTIKYLQENKPIIIGDNNSGDYLLYIPNKKVFLGWYHENGAGNGMQININDTYTYSQIIDDAKKLVIKSYKEYIQADAELGYYRLSEPPKGVERKEF